MKKLILLLSLIFGCESNLIAQSYPLREKLDLVFSNIDKSQIPTGFLAEFGPRLVPLKTFNGVLADSNKVDIGTWRYIYGTLQTSHIYGTNPLPNLSTANNTIENAETTNPSALPIPLIYANYSYLRSDAVSLNLLSIQNNQLFDVPGRTQSPYVTSTVFAAAPSISHANTGSPSVIFKEELFFKNSPKTLSSIQIDFNDGRGYLSAVWDYPLSAQYLTKGQKQIKIKLTFTDASVVQCYSYIEITEIQGGQARYPTDSDGYESFSAPDHAGGKAYFKYSTLNTTNPKRLKKPLIVVEGYDMSSIAPKLQSNYSYSSFRNEIMVFFTSGPLFNDQLDEVAGYDLVFIDYNNGTDDIRRNAALVKQVINWVNAQKASVTGHEPNVVMGISMGGLVARYALADMTKQGLDPKTRLLITHDSPHRGANTPLGLQALTKAFDEADILPWLSVTDLNAQARQAANVLNAPATQQLLIGRALSGSGGYAPNTFLDNEYRSMITFGTSGPQPAYNVIAVSLGSECGVGVLDPSTLLIRANQNALLSPALFGLGFGAEIVVNSLPSLGTSAMISKFRFWIDAEILFIPIQIETANRVYYSPSNLLPWDGVPGGTQKLSDQVNVRIPTYQLVISPFLFLGSAGSGGSGSTPYTFPGDFCFVPTVSALDVTTINQSTVNMPYTAGVSVTNPARVSNFIAQERIGTSNDYNVTHPRFNARNAEWIFKEMENPINNTMNCSTLCSANYGASIGTPSYLCYGVPQNAFLNGAFPPGATISWTAQPASSFSLSSGTGRTASLNVTDPNFSGTFQLRYEVLGLCNPLSISTWIWVGPPSGQINGPTEVYPDQVYPYSAGPNGNPYAFFWTISGSGHNFGCCDTQPTVQVYWTAGSGGAVNLLSTNGCGTTSSSLPVTISTEGGCNPCQIVMPYPNPSSDEMSVAIDEVYASSKKEKATPYYVLLYDITGMVVYKNSTEEDVLKIPVKDFPAGVYFLKITNANGVSTSKQIQVAR